MRRHQVRPYGQSITAMRAVSLLMMLGVLWMAYGWIKNPATWKMFGAGDEMEQAAADPADSNEPATATKAPAEPENVVPGPNDLDPVAVKNLNSKLELVTDKAPLKPGEMPMYWQLMGWSRTESFDKLKKRAAKGVAFSQIWESSDKYRGKLVHLKLHVRRVLKYEVDDSPLGVKTVYEAWGWTEDSKSFPYVVVFADRPAGLPIGTDVMYDMEFTGYFLKVMSYTAFDVSRGAPLLIGRVKAVIKPPPPPASPIETAITVGIAVLGICTLIGIGLWSLYGTRKRPQKVALPLELAPLDVLFDSPRLPVTGSESEGDLDPDLGSTPGGILQPVAVSATNETLSSSTDEVSVGSD